MQREKFEKNMITLCHFKARRYLLALAGMYMKSGNEEGARHIHSLLRRLRGVVVNGSNKLEETETIDS